VLRPYTSSMQRLIDTGAYNRGRRPSGHVVGNGFTKDNGGAIPPNLIEVSNTRWDDPYQEWCRAHAVDPHPARFPRDVPHFFIRFLTDEGDLVLDPFAGSNVTGALAEELGRRWVAFEKERGYLRGSRSRFEDGAGRLPGIK
jgi:DNA modification methylase